MRIPAPRSLRGKLLGYGALVTLGTGALASWLAARAAAIESEQAVLFHQAILVLLIVGLLAPLWVFLERSILRPVRWVVEADRRPDPQDLAARLIPNERIPDHEIGDMMRSRNQLLHQIGEMQSSFRRSLKHLAALSSASVRLLEAGELRSFLDQVLDGVAEALLADAAEIALYHPQQQRFTLRVRRVAGVGFHDEPLPAPAPGCPCQQALASKGPVVLNELDQAEQTLVLACLLDGYRACLAVPLMCADRTVGVLACFRRNRPFSEADADTLMAVGYLVALSLEHARLHAATVQMAITDELTGLYTRRYFFERLEEEVRRARRLRRPFSVIMLDLDNFKECNDRFGHLVGDEVLRRVARHLATAVRQSDIVARYGGDEFVVLLPETGKQEAAVVARRLCQLLQLSCDSQVVQPYRVRISASLGVATFPDDADTPERLLARADSALYSAKARGGQTAFAWPVADSPPAPELSSGSTAQDDQAAAGPGSSPAA